MFEKNPLAPEVFCGVRGKRADDLPRVNECGDFAFVTVQACDGPFSSLIGCIKGQTGIPEQLNGFLDKDLLTPLRDNDMVL